LDRREEVAGIGDARESESGGLVAGVEAVEQAVEPRQALVDILRCEVDAVIVVPERAERLVGIAVRRMRRAEPGERVGIVVVVELAGRKEVARKAVAL